nr:hypothetical protein [Pseudomonas sp. HS-2]
MRSGFGAGQPQILAGGADYRQAATPRIAGSCLGHRPAQVTQDLASFCANTHLG